MGRTRDTSKVYVQSGLLTSTITSNYSASNNETIFVNTASSAITVTLPSSPSAGSKIKVLDVAANSQNNNITVLGNGYNIGGASAYIINTPDSSVEVLYINSSKGWNVANEYVSLAKPGTPTGVSAVDVGTGRAYNNGAATVSFTASSSGGPADTYTVTSTPGSYTGVGTSSPILVQGLQSGVSYTFKVSATNAAGTSSDSVASSSITATTVPQAPTIDSVSYGFESLYVNYTAGATGGKAVSSYTATRTGAVTASGSSPITFSSLTGGTTYSVSMVAANENGTSATSNSLSNTPFTATGGTIKTSGNYRYHTFTASSTMTVSGNSIPSADYLIVAGGGSGATCIDDGSGGGGAGGLLYSSTSLTTGVKSITVGAGANAVSTGNGYVNGNNGNNSSLDSFIAVGGGYGGGGRNGGGGNGGSGGGGGGGYTGGMSFSGGTNTVGQGNPGGSGAQNSSAGGRVGGGGGGASATGSSPGNGGNGTDYSTWYGVAGGTFVLAGGGGGAVGTGGSYSGGSGGGGAGNGTAGTVNTGGGGGGKGANGTSGAGGSGIVVVRYQM